MEKRYFNDSDRFVAELDNGDRGYFVRRGFDPTDPWCFVVPGSIHWDSLHQDIHYAGHDLDPCPPELVARLPELPPVPEFTRMNWADNFRPASPILASSHPLLAALLARSDGGQARFWFILEEDLYETRHGDGSFEYFHGLVFDNETAALRLTESHNAEMLRLEREAGQLGSEYSVKSFAVALEDNILVPKGWEPRGSQHYRVEELLAGVERALTVPGGGWGSRKA